MPNMLSSWNKDIIIIIIVSTLTGFRRAFDLWDLGHFTSESLSNAFARALSKHII